MWAIAGIVEYQSLSGCVGNLRCFLLLFSCNIDHSLRAECHHIFFIGSNDDLEECHSHLESCFSFFSFGYPSPNFPW